MTSQRQRWPRRLVALLVLLGLLLLGIIFFMWFETTENGRDPLLRSLAQICGQFLLVGVIGLLIKEYLDDRRDQQRQEEDDRRDQQRQEEADRRDQQRQQDAADEEERRRQDAALEMERRRQDALDIFRLDVVRRLVGTANRVRRAGIELDAGRSVEVYVKQMQSLTDAYLDLRLLMHEVEGATGLPNPVFPDWTKIEPNLGKMRSYLHKCVREFRDKNAELQRRLVDQQPPAEHTADIWAVISSFPRVSELLVDDLRPPGKLPPALWTDFFGPYEDAIPMIRRAILRGETEDRNQSDVAADVPSDEDQSPQSAHPPSTTSSATAG